MDESTKYMIVKKAVDGADPYGLLEIGAPGDEYDFESKMISSAISVGDSEERIAEITAEVFAKEFNWKITADRFRDLARNVWNELHKGGLI